MNTKRIRVTLILAMSLFLIAFSNSISSAQKSDTLPALKIVQLGDSYSAGNGARDADGERNYYSVSGCYRSPTNWGSQYAASLGDRYAVTYINKACSGGVLQNITEARDMKDSVPSINGACPSPSYPDEEFYNLNAKNECLRFINRQASSVDESVDLVLMTMGGNDLQFNNIVMNCFALGFRHPTACENSVNNAYQLLGKSPRYEDGDMKSMMLRAFSAIRKNMKPGAKIVYVSYPQILLDVNYKVLWEGFGTKTYEAGDALIELAEYAESMQKAIVAEANEKAGEEYIIFYDDTKELFNGHEPHPEADKKNPDGWLHEFMFSVDYINVESYHPNMLGHLNWARALSDRGDFGVIGGGGNSNNADVDVVFVVDTTGSMGDEIAQVRAELSALVNKLASSTNSYRVAVVSYRDFPERTGNPSDYPARVDQTFTNELSDIQAAIDSLTAEGGEDDPESVFSGMQAAIELPWRPGVTKTMLVIGDAPALSPEPISGLTASQIITNSIAVDPVQVIALDIASLDSGGTLTDIANGTGGAVLVSTTQLTDTILGVLDDTAKKPLAWMGQAYSGKINEPIHFDASGSYDPAGAPISIYEWDFNNDGIYDLETPDPSASHTYTAEYNDYVVLRVTSPGGTALASARTVVNAEGFVSQGDEEACELDENGYSIIVDENGIFIPCTADHLPTEDQDGVRVVYDGAPVAPSGSSNIRTGAGAGGIFPFVIFIILGSAVLVYYAKARQKNALMTTILTAYLQVTEDPHSARTIPLKKNFIIGRAQGVDLRLADNSTSRQHARITHGDGAWYIQDMGSSGGTFVNGQRIQAARLNSGDRIKIGQATFIFRTQ